MIEHRIVNTIAITVFLVLLAGFAGVLSNPRNTLALVDAFIRWLRPSASSDIDRFHTMTRDLGHFLIPAAAFGTLVIGRLRKDPLFCVSVVRLIRRDRRIATEFYTRPKRLRHRCNN